MTEIAGENAISEVANVKETDDQERRGISFSLKNISVRFGGIKALDSITMEARASDTIGVIGNNGAGKTTLCNVISGITRINKGSVMINDKKATRMSPRSRARRGLRRIFENPVYFDALSVEENVLIGSQTYRGEGLLSALITPRIFRRERIETARRILEYCNVDVTQSHEIKELDYVTKKKVELARALMGNPRILVLDEPTRSMSDDDKAEYCQVVADYVETFSTTLVIVDHDTEVIRSLCKRAFALDAGELLADGEVVPVLRNDRVQSRYLMADVKK